MAKGLAQISFLCLSLFFAVVSPAWSQGNGAFSTFDIPGAGTGAIQGTFGVAINATGEITGLYRDANGAAHGYLRSPGGTITFIDAVGAGTGATQGTFPVSINEAGDVAGMYFDANNGYHGFVRPAATGIITEFDVTGAPTTIGHRGTIPLSIDTAGDIAGFYVDSSDVRHGFLRTVANGAVTYTAIEVTGAGTGGLQGTICVSINASGEITGSYADTNTVFHGFVRATNGTITAPIDAPGAATTTQNAASSIFHLAGTASLSIDSAGDITGTYADASGVLHGFIRSAGGTITAPIDAPGAGAGMLFSGTGAAHINDAGEISGIYTDASGVLHGFARTATGTIVAPLNDPSAGTTAKFAGTIPLSVDASGALTGTYADTNGVFHGFVLTTGTVTAITSISPNPSVSGQSVVITATVNSSNGAPSNGEAVTFMQGATVLGSGTLAAGSASFTTSTLAVATYSVTAVYAGDANFAGSTSAAVSLVVNPGPTQVATPTFNVPPGSYSSAQTVTISDATAGATIYYTTNGTTPTASSTQFTSAIPVSSTETIEAIAVATGLSNSAVAAATYTIGVSAPNEWTWVGGSSGTNQIGVYGTLGTAAAGNIPGARVGAMSWTDKLGNLWLFGGSAYDSAGAVGSINDLWMYSAGQWTWVGGSNLGGKAGTYGTQGTAAASNIPGARSGSSTWTDAAGNFWLFGGSGNDSVGTSGFLNDLWKYSAGQWTWVSGPDIASQKGIYGTQGTAAASNVPGARSKSATWVDAAGNLWLFGGYGNDSSGASGDLNDLWEYSAGKWTWVNGSNLSFQTGTYGTLGTAAATNVPGARNLEMSWTDKSGNFWLFGGAGLDSAGTSGELNDLWKYSGGQWTWMGGSNFVNQTGIYGTLRTATAGSTPGARQGSVMWTDADGNEWIFGGAGFDSVGGVEGFLSDMWQYSGGQWTWMAGSNLRGQRGIYGTEGTAAASDAPGGRNNSVAWTDAAGSFWLFGGNGFASSGANATLNDFWEYRPSPTTTTLAATPTFSPASGTYPPAQMVTISDVTSGATIYYTTDGTTPTTASTRYSGAITVNSTETIEAIATASGFSNSAVGSATYTIATTITYTIGGTVTGLSGTGLVLQNNGGNNLPISADGNFVFTAAIATGGTYKITVLTDPSNSAETCGVTNGSGIATANVINVQVVCAKLPVITSLMPSTGSAGAQGLSMLVNGNNFDNGATVLWNGSAVVTTWVSASQLQASVPSTDLASMGIVSITVANPASAGGGASNAFRFVINTGTGTFGAFTVTTTTPILNVTPGQPVTLQVTFNGLPAGATIAVTCVNLPAGASCSYSNSVVTITTSAATPAGSYPITVVFVATIVTTAMNNDGHLYLAAGFGFAGFPLGLLWMFGGRKKAIRGCLLLLFALLLILPMTSCSSGGGGGGAGNSNQSTTTTTQSSLPIILNAN